MHKKTSGSVEHGHRGGQDGLSSPQFTEGGICRAVPAAAAVILPLLERLSQEGLITAQGHVIDMVKAFSFIFTGLAGMLLGNGQAATTGFAKKAIPFWEEVRQHSTLQRLAQLTAACRVNSANRWEGAGLMGAMMESLFRSHPWAGDREVDSRTAALNFHHAAARDPAFHSFVSETLVLLCADLMARQCDLSPQEAARQLDSTSISVYCTWIETTTNRGDWAPAGLRVLYSSQGMVSCLAPFVYSAPGASASFTIKTFCALMAAKMVLRDVPDETNCPSVGGGRIIATEKLVQGMLRQAAALLQLRRLPAVKCLTAAKKAATTGFLQGPPEHVINPDGSGKTLRTSVDDSLETLVRAAGIITLMCGVQLLKDEPSVVEPRDWVMTLEAVMRTQIYPMQGSPQEALVAVAEAVERVVRAGPWPADRALSFAISLRKAMPAGSNPESLILTVKQMAQSLPVPTLQSVTLETLPFLMRAVGGCGRQGMAGALSSLTELGELLHKKGCAAEVNACAVESAVCQQMVSAEVLELAKAKQTVVGGQAVDPHTLSVDPCTLDVEALRMQHPVLGCFNPRCTSMSGVSEDLMRTQRCRACRRAAYCGTECQTAHWPAHKASCAVCSASLAAEAASAAGLAPEAVTDGVD